MLSKRLKCGTTSGVDLSLLGYLADSSARALGVALAPKPSCSQADELVTSLSPDELMRKIESNQLQLGIVSLEHLLDYLSQTQRTSIRVVGEWLSGDCRALVSLDSSPSVAEKRILGAAHPASAFARWQDISCAFDLECSEDRAEEIPSCRMPQALIQGRFAMLELNLFWEGLVGFRRGLIVNSARSSDYGIPQGASHLLVSNQKTIAEYSQLLKDFRLSLVDVYKKMLEDVELFADRWSSSKVFQYRPNFGFLLASARILAPHFEESVRTGGRFDFEKTQKFIRWFASRVPALSDTGQGLYPAVSLEDVLCDVWN